MNVPFYADRDFERDLPRIAALVLAFSDGYGDRHVDEAPYFFRVYQELVDAAEGDFFLEIPSEIRESLELFVRHVIRLRHAVGLLKPLPPLGLFRGLSRRLGFDGETMAYGLLSRFIRLLTPKYLEALLLLRGRLEATESVEPQAMRLLRLLEATAIDVDTARREESDTIEWLRGVLRDVADGQSGATQRLTESRGQLDAALLICGSYSGSI